MAVAVDRHGVLSALARGRNVVHAPARVVTLVDVILLPGSTRHTGEKHVVHATSVETVADMTHSDI